MTIRPLSVNNVQIERWRNFNVIWRRYPTEESRPNHRTERKTRDGRRNRLSVKKTKAKVGGSQQARGGGVRHKEGALS